MRKLGLLLASLTLLVFPVAATAAWNQAGTPHVVFEGATDLRFDPTGQGTLRTNSSLGYISNTTDNGATWSALQSFQTPPGSNFEYGSDALGNRAWVWSQGGTKIRVQRTGPTGVPALVGSNEYTFSTGLELKIVVNSGGDALIVGPTGAGVNVAFWPAGASVPSYTQTVAISDPTGYSSFSSIIPFLDPSGSATIVFTGANAGEHSFQTSSPDAHVSDSFATPVEFSDASTIRGAQGVDGRGLLLLSDDRDAPTNSYGQASTFTLKYATRAPGEAFGPVSFLDGDDDHATTNTSSVAVSPNGGVIFGWRTALNKPGGSYPCEELQQHSVTRAASGTIQANGGISLSPQTLSASGHFGYGPIVAAGPDGRVGVVWQERVECPSTPGFFAAFSAVPGPVSTVDALPYAPSALAFNRCGALFAFGTEAGTFKSHTKQFGTSLACPIGGGPTGPVDPGGGGTTDPPGGTTNPIVVPTQTVGSITASKGGKLSIKLDFNVAGTVSLIATSGKTIVAKSSVRVKLGINKFQIKLNSKAAKKLKKTGKLKAKLTMTFTPVSGAAPAPLTKPVTFKK